MAEEVPRTQARQGLVQIFTGDGKGKTTAALGTALRALGHGLKVFVAVFMKGDYPYGEWEALATFPNATIMRFGFRDFTDPNHVKPEESKPNWHWPRPVGRWLGAPTTSLSWMR
jgi:ATP:corrinoid adenosyltransferase